jgi:glycosyltransferase involved in cell wall biosynthesis
MKENKSILFVQGRFAVGGVERVTVLLANAFVARGWKVAVAVFKLEQLDLLRQLSPGIVVHELGMPFYRLSSVSSLRKLMRELRTTHVINQWAFPYLVTLMLRMAMPSGARLVCVYHTMPNRNKRALEAVGIKRRLIEWALRLNSRLIYHSCDAYVVLSETYSKVFKDFVGLKRADKLFAIPNPLSPAQAEEVVKENVVLYVGRLSRTEKRVDRVIEVWRSLEAALPDWRLEILGDGPDRGELEKRVADLPRISFRGFQPPEAYYAKAKILLLTSDFEGFPMTLVEGMSAGCVPVVYGSFPTAAEIVTDDCGVVVRQPWSADEFAKAVRSLATNERRREEMSSAGKVSVRRFDLDRVVEKYLSVMKDRHD